MTIKPEYNGEDAKEAVIDVAHLVNRHWKSVQMPMSGHGISSMATGQYSIIFAKEKLLGGVNYLDVSFSKEDVNSIKVHFNNESIPSQVIITLKNMTEIMFTRGNNEGVDVLIKGS